VNALQKRIVVDEHGKPLEVIIPWAQFCEMTEALGLDLEVDAIEDLREATRAWASGAKDEFVPLAAR
jgi:hypothetical protein